MKHLKLFFALFAMLALGVTNAWAEVQSITEDFEKQTQESTYNAVREYPESTSNASIAWYVEHGVVSTNNKLSGNQSLQMRAYYPKSSATNVWNGALPYLESKTPIKGLANITFNGKVGNATLKVDVMYSTDGLNWTKLATAASYTTSSKQYSYDIPNPSITNDYYIKIAVNSSSTHAAKPSKNGNIALIVDDITFTYETSGSTEPALTSIQIDGELTKDTYEEGEEFDFSGLTVQANYESGDPKDVTKDVEWSYTPNPLTKGTTSVDVTATYEDKTATKIINGLTVNEHIVTPGAYDITLNNVFFGTTASANITGPVTGKQNDITITINGTGSTKPRTDATYTRFYASSTMAISVPSGYVIKSIAITKNESDYAAPSVNVGTFNTSTKTWTGTANSVTMSFSAKSFINSIKVTYVADVKYALNITTPSNGTLVVKDGENVLTSGAEIYEGTKLTIIATPETGYEEGVVVVKNASDEYITATVYADGVLTMPAYAVTISATFAKKPCELLAKPTVSATTTYSSATLTWGAVTNAAKYSVKVGTAEAVVTTETSYEVIGLTAETEYAYQVQAIAADGQTDYCDSEVAEGSFTTTAAPAAILTLKDIVGTKTLTGSLNGTITLPTEAAECSKTFVGWDADENCDHAPTYALGAEYTFTTQDPTLYAVYADGEDGEAVAIFSETFDVCDGTGGNDSKWSGTIASTELPDALKNTWTVANAYAANKCAKFGGSSNKQGSAETPSIALTGTATLTFRAAAWNGGSEGTTLNVSAKGATLDMSSVTLKKAEWTEYTIAITDATGSVKIKFEAKNASNNRFFLDDVVVSQASVNYSNYSTTCAAAAVATVDPTSVTATVAGGNGKVEVTYENVNTTNVSVALYNDAACTEAFSAGWLTADLDGDKHITYTVSATTLYTERKAYIQLTAPETTGATDPAVVVIPVTQAAKDKVFASLEELVAADLTAGDEVSVTLNNDVIKDFYIYSSKRCGVVFDVQKDGKDIKIYFNNQTTIDDWAVGGKLSGTLTNVKWTTYSSAWQLAPANTWAWANLTYTEPKAVSTVVVSGAPTKTTYVDGEAFDPAGLTVTVNYNDATSEVNPTGVTFAVTPATLVKDQTSVSVTATFNSVTSAAYEVTGLTVNDIPTKTVAEFIAAEGGRCYLEGIVSDIDNTTYGNFNLTDASGTIYVYGCLNKAGESKKFAELGVKNGDKIKVIADEYELFGGTKDEAKNVQYVSHISAATITIADITMEVGKTKAIAATVVPAEAEVTYTIKENAANAISLSGNTITALAEGTATITATVAEGATYLGNSVDFTVTVTPESTSDEVVILAELDGKWYAMKGAVPTGKSNQLDALKVTYFNGTLYNVAESDKASITWTRSIVDGKATFVNNGKYLKGDTDSDLTLSASVDDKCKWMWDDENGYYTTNSSGTIRTFLYRENFNFKNYAVSEAGNDHKDGNYSSLPVVTAPVYATGDVVYTRTVTLGNYGTICLPYGSSDYTGAEFYEVSWLQKNGETPVNLYLDQLAEGTSLVAGKPYIFRATSTELTVTCTGDAVAAPVEGANGLTGSFDPIPAGGVLTGNYVIAKNKFWTATDEASAAANRAYIDATEVEKSEPALIPGRRRVVLGSADENAETGVDNIITTDAPVKVIENGQLIIIRDGVKYNVQGQKL